MASELIEELKIVATKAKKSQRDIYSGQLMGSPNGGRGHSRERDSNSTGRSRSRRRRAGGEERRRRGGGENGGVGAGLFNSEKNGRIRWQPSLIERLS